MQPSPVLSPVAPTLSTLDADPLSLRTWRDPQRWVEAGRHQLAYWRFGRGPDLVFLHGWPLRAATFRALIPELAKAFTCHLFDLPGSGFSRSQAGAGADFAAHADAVRAAADALQLERYAILAHDSGGLTARLVAAGDERVAALVLGNTEVPGHTPGVIRRLVAASKFPGGPELLRTLMKVRAVRRSPLGYGGCFADLDFLDGDFHTLLVAPLLASREAFGRQMEIIRQIDLSLVHRLPGIHARIRAPVLLLWGAEDAIFPLALARQMTAQLADARLEVLAGGKLFVHEEQSDRFASLARAFLELRFGPHAP